MTGILLTLCLMAGLIPLAVSAAESGQPTVQEAAHTHCVCGGEADIGDHTEHTDITWMAWTATDSLPVTAGNYYLVDDVTLTFDFVKVREWKVGADINLCLNGKTISTNGTFASVEKGVTFSLTDCTGGGKVFCGSDYLEVPEAWFKGRLPGMRCEGASTFKMFGGTLLLNEAAKDADNKLLLLDNGSGEGSTFHMYGGSLGEASHIGTEAEGKYLYAGSYAKFNAYGGAVYGHTHFVVGANIFFGDTAFATNVRLYKDYTERYSGTPKCIGDARLIWQYHMYILSGETRIAADDLNKNDILGDGGSVKYEFDDTTKTGTLTLTNAHIVYSDENSNVLYYGTEYALRIVLVGENVFSPAKDTWGRYEYFIRGSRQLTFGGAGNLNIISNRRQGFATQYAIEAGLEMVASESATGVQYISIMQPHVHCVCGGTTDVGDHDTHADETWKPWNTPDALPTEAGNYYLVNDVTLTRAWSVGENINLCLNGKTITQTGEYDYDANNTTSVAVIEADKSLTLTDCAGGGKLTGGEGSFNAGSSGRSGGGVLCKDKSTFIMFGGSIEDCKAINGGGVYVGNAVFRMYGGRIENCEGQSHSYSGAVCVSSGAEFTMFGGYIGKCKTEAVDGPYCISVKNGTMNALGGRIDSWVDVSESGNLVSSETGTEFSGVVRIFYSGTVNGVKYAPLDSLNTVDGGKMLITYNIRMNKVYLTSDDPFTYDAASGKGILTLDNVDFIAGDSTTALDTDEFDTVEIVLVGENRLKGDDRCIAVNNLIFSGTGSIRVEVDSNWAISCDSITVNSGNVYVVGKSSAVYVSNSSSAGSTQSKGAVTVNGGTLTMVATNYEALNSRIDPLIALGQGFALFTGETSDGSDLTLTETSDTTTIKSAKYIMVASSHTHCVCGGTTDVGDHKTHTDVVWTPWVSTGSLPAKGGNYYLVNDVTLSDGWWACQAGDVKLCLNGKKITVANRNYINVEAEATLTLSDCVGSGVVSADGINGYSVNVEGNLHMYGGTIVNTSEVVEEHYCVTLSGDVDREATFRLYGGTVGNDENGGAVWLGVMNLSEKFYAYGGTVEGMVYCLSGYTIYFYETEFRSVIHIARLRPGEGTPIFSGKGRFEYFYPTSIGQTRGEVWITDANKDDVFGDGTVKYEFIVDGGMVKGVLTLNNAHISADNSYGIILPLNMYDEQYSCDLDIVLIGTNTIEQTGAGSGMWFPWHKLTFRGDGKLDVRSRSTAIRTCDITNTKFGKIAVSGGTLTLSVTDENGKVIDGGTENPDIEISAEMSMVTDTTFTYTSPVLTEADDYDKISGAKYVSVSAKHAHCICGDATGSAKFDGHASHLTDTVWTPWVATDSLPTAPGNYYLVNNVTLPEGELPLPGSVTLCLNGKSIRCAGTGGTKLTVDGLLSLTDCIGTGSIGNITLARGSLTMWGGKIAENTFLRIEPGNTFAMEAGSVNEGDLIIEGNVAFTMEGNAKNLGRILLSETDKYANILFCGSAEGGIVQLETPQEGILMRVAGSAKIAGLYGPNSVVRVALVMEDNAEIGKVENVNFTEPKLGGNVKLGTADSTFGIIAKITEEAGKNFTIGENVQIFGTVTVAPGDGDTFTLADKASVTGELILKAAGITGQGVKIVMTGESAVHGKLTCEDAAIAFEMQGSAVIDGEIDLGDCKVNGKVTCTGNIIGGIFHGDVENNGKISGGIFYGTVTGTGTIEDSAKVSVIFATDGGSAVETQKILRGQKAKVPAAATKTGYTFGGWTIGGAAFDFETPILEETTLTAVWAQCDHSASTAKPTCTAPATCTVCAGTMAALGHDPKPGYRYDETVHWTECTRCTDKLTLTAHTGGTATCTRQAECEICGVGYGAMADHRFIVRQHDETQHWNKCSQCDATTVKTRHKGGTATCTKRAECDVCGTTYGEFDKTNHTGTVEWVKTAATHEKRWNCCGTVASEAEGHHWKNGSCTECRYSCLHAGGTETRDSKSQSCTESGYTGDVYCKACGEKRSSGGRTPGRYGELR